MFLFALLLLLTVITLYYFLKPAEGFNSPCARCYNCNSMDRVPRNDLNKPVVGSNTCPTCSCAYCFS